MPQTKRERKTRVNVRLPKPMIDEIDRLSQLFSELGYNRQQFVESAIREKIEKLKIMEMQGQTETQSYA